ncbi:MAG: hypothetical protein ACLTDC_10660 [Lachnospiraceae bacterium]
MPFESFLFFGRLCFSEARPEDEWFKPDDFPTEAYQLLFFLWHKNIKLLLVVQVAE